MYDKTVMTAGRSFSFAMLICAAVPSKSRIMIDVVLACTVVAYTKIIR